MVFRLGAEARRDTTQVDTASVNPGETDTLQVKAYDSLYFLPSGLKPASTVDLQRSDDAGGSWATINSSDVLCAWGTEDWEV